MKKIAANRGSVWVLTCLAMWIGGCSSEKKAYDPHVSKDVSSRISQAYGVDRWQYIRLLRFDMVVRRDGHPNIRTRHLWDRSTNNYRYEADATQFANMPIFNKKSEIWEPMPINLPAGNLIALVNRRTRKGQVYINGRPVKDEQLLDHVFQRIDNDTFMLMMPIDLAQADTRGQTYPVEHSDGTFGEVYRFHYPPKAGSTPNDLWALYYDPQTMHIHQSKIKPQYSVAIKAADWTQNVTIHGVTFCLKRTFPDKKVSFEGLTIPRVAPDGIFTNPNTVLH